MSEQSLRPRGPQPPQRLRPLEGLTPEQAAFAQHLRDVREDLGMPSSGIAKWLEENEPGAAVDASRLSRFLSGSDLPPPALLPALYRLLASSRAVDPERIAEGWRLLYAAARTKGPLVARAYKDEASWIAVEEDRVRTAHELAVLREEADRERLHRERIEKGLGDLFDRADGTHEQVADLEGELGRVTRRIEELEDLVRQHEAAVRLLRADADRARRAREETASEIDLWRGGVPAPLAGDPSAIADAVAAFRDEGADERADRLLALAAGELPAAALAELYAVFRDTRRPLELARLSRSIGALCRAKDIVELTAPQIKFYRGNGDDTFMPLTPWACEVLAEAGARAPHRELLLLARLLDENDRSDHRSHLILGLRHRTEGLAEIAASGVFRRSQVPRARTAATARDSGAEPPGRRWFRP
ncbi:hypothetical protein [Streptomyces sp. NPDC047976]|uniref:hypothetical protein n=1 Tax=Streptomyces sp. NPDC047976 TaxID=3155746 RepID=UPI00343A06C0